MKADVELYGTDCEIIADEKQPGQLMLRFRLVDHKDGRAERTEKHAHVTVTTKQAMILLSMLQSAQKAFGLVAPPTVEQIIVPPAKDRN